MHVLIVGGGVMGAATAWFLRTVHDCAVTVLERDLGYTLASSARSVCAIRQQFSTAINVRVSQASLAFYRTIDTALAIGDERPAIGLVEPGYLYLAATPDGAAVLREQQALQAAHDVHTAVLEPSALRARFPWMATDDVQLASLGLSTATSGEGWFDGYAAMQAFRRGAATAGAMFIEADVTGFTTTADRVTGACTRDGRTVDADVVVIAGGAWSRPLGAALGMTLPVHARKRDVFAFEASPDAHDAPLVIDPSGLWFRPERVPGQYLCGAPPRGLDADDVPLDEVDHGMFDAWLWPRLAARVPAFDALRVTGSWAGYYEMNTFDHNGLVGRLAPWRNTYTACGFSGHGLQQAPAIGRGLAELIATGAYHTLDLTPLDVGRVARGERLLERNVI